MREEAGVGKLMVGVARVLPICALISIVLSGIAAQPAHAKLGPISIRSVYTTDGNFTLKTVFAPGARINYHVDVDNTTGSAFPIKIRFEVFANYATKPNLYSYDQTYDVAQMPIGLSRFYNTVTLPSNAAIYWYILRITITPSNCSGTGCGNDGDWGSSTFNIQKTEVPEGGEAQNLIVLVHGCCTDANGVSEWNALADEIEKRINPREWEVVVWDWHEYTPPPPSTSCIDPKSCADIAYQNAKQQGPVLANAIKIYPYKHVHFIGHSAGAKLIHEAATAYISDYFVRQQNPFIHMTFLDAYTPNDWDKNGTSSYGSLPANYPYHYSEHYVDRGFYSTDACLTQAFNFDITGWISADKGNSFPPGHNWPRYWYEDSITIPGFSKYGYPLSFEGGYSEYKGLSAWYPKSTQCPLSDANTTCIPAACWP